MLETADRPVSHDDNSAAPSGGSPIALNAINRWVPHNLVMRDSWFPVAHDYSVTGKPVRRAVYSHPIFLWRDNGVAVLAFWAAAALIMARRPNSPGPGDIAFLRWGFLPLFALVAVLAQLA